ncbi:MAG: hypothetical protein VYB54_09635 [Pseudomonadota bacterium]|nr:hypothetical protein [Pseudomonadota bacterium]
MADHYLRFTDASEAATMLAAAGFLSETGAVHALDTFGVVWDDAVMDGDTMLTPPAPRSGFHVNLRLLSGTLPASLAGKEISPATPYRTFAS